MRGEWLWADGSKYVGLFYRGKPQGRGIWNIGGETEVVGEYKQHVVPLERSPPAAAAAAAAAAGAGEPGDGSKAGVSAAAAAAAAAATRAKKQQISVYWYTHEVRAKEQ